VRLVARIAVGRPIASAIRGDGVLMDAFSTDVRPLPAEPRTEQGLDPDPTAAYARSGYDQRIVAERVGGTQAGWGA
jgi:L-rhamnose isomerase / sugar isomerase